MRGSLAKRIRQYVRRDFPHLTQNPLYIKHRVTGRVQLAQQCQRALVQHIKKAYKRNKQYA